MCAVYIEAKKSCPQIILLGGNMMFPKCPKQRTKLPNCLLLNNSNQIMNTLLQIKITQKRKQSKKEPTGRVNPTWLLCAFCRNPHLECRKKGAEGKTMTSD